MSFNANAINLTKNYLIPSDTGDCHITESTDIYGNKTIVIVEGNIIDEILVKTNGDIFLNDKHVTFSFTSEMPIDSTYSFARSGLIRYFSASPISGSANDYTTYVSRSLNVSVQFEQAIINLSKFTISVMLVYALGIPSADNVSTFFDALGFIIKTYATDHAPSATSCTYNQYVYEHATLSTQLDRLYKTDLTYYVSGVYVCGDTYYENYFYN